MQSAAIGMHKELPQRTSQNSFIFILYVLKQITCDFFGSSPCFYLCLFWFKITSEYFSWEPAQRKKFRYHYVEEIR